jgi:septal ring factor EnvC (AmiA/AmiB activator)
MIELSPLALSILFLIFGLGIIVGVVIAKLFSEDLSRKFLQIAEDDYRKFSELLSKAIQKNFAILEESRSVSQKEISSIVETLGGLTTTFESIKSNMVQINNQTLKSHQVRKELENEIIKLKNIIKRYEKRGIK